MRDWLDELLVVLSHSTRTRWCLYIGVLFAIFVQILGRWMIRDFELTGGVAPMTDVIRAILRDRYDATSLAILVTTLATASRLYRSDRKRLFEL